MQFGFFGLLPAFFFASIVPSLKADEVSENTFAPVEGAPLIIAQPPRWSAAMPPARSTSLDFGNMLISPEGDVPPRIVSPSGQAVAPSRAADAATRMWLSDPRI